MKRERFSGIFLLTAFIIFLASNRNLYSSILLMCAAVYRIIDLIEHRKDIGAE